MKVKFSYTYISHERANEILEELNKRCIRVYRESSENINFDTNNIISNGFTCYHKISSNLNSVYDTLQFRLAGKWYNYKLDKTVIRPKDYKFVEINPVQAVSQFVKMVKYPYYPQVKMTNLGAIHYVNPKYEGQLLHNCICYDRNKAYLATCIDLLLPLSYLGALYRCPEEGEIGFNTTGIPIYGPSNKKCKYLFKSGYLPSLTKWAENKIEALNEAKTPEEKKTIKDGINIAIGNLGNKNEGNLHINKAIRNTIVYQMNEFITNLIDDNTLYSNTDSIVSLVPRPELKVSDKVGDFKIEHKGDFTYIGTNYQWNEGEVSGKNSSLQSIWEKVKGRKFKLGQDDPKEFLYYKPIEFDKNLNKYIVKEF